MRPATHGFSLAPVERTARGIRVAVRRDGTPAGGLAGLATDRGPTWFQIAIGAAPAVGQVADTLATRRAAVAEGGAG